LSTLLKNIKLYSKLVLSVGQQGRGISKKQELSPVECGECIKRLMDEQKETKLQVAERLDIGRPKKDSSMYKKRDLTTLNMFLDMLYISQKSKYVAGWGWQPKPKIAFSTILQLQSLSHDEQDYVIQTVLDKFKQNKLEGKKENLGKSDFKKIVDLRKNNPKLSIEEIIEKVWKLKPKTIIKYIVVCETFDKLNEYTKSNDNSNEKLLSILKNNMNGEFFSLDVNDILITIEMDKTAFELFEESQNKQGVSFTRFLNIFLEDKLG